MPPLGSGLDGLLNLLLCSLCAYILLIVFHDIIGILYIYINNNQKRKAFIVSFVVFFLMTIIGISLMHRS